MLSSLHDVQIQVVVGAPDGDGRRTLEIYSRSADPGEAVDAAWTRHAPASAVPGDDLEPALWPTDLTPGRRPGRPNWTSPDRTSGSARSVTPTAPPSPGCAGLGGWVIELVAEADAARGARGRRGVWLAPGRCSTPAQHSLAVFQLDSRRDDPADSGVRAPFLWSGVRLFASGAAALRLVFSPTGPSSWSVDGFDTTASAGAEGGLDWSPARCPPSRLRDAGRARRRAVRAGLGGVRTRRGRFEGGRRRTDRAWRRTSDHVRTARTVQSEEQEHTADAGSHPDLAALGRAVDGGVPLPEVVVLRVPGPPDQRVRWRTRLHIAVNSTLRVLQDWLADGPVAAVAAGRGDRRRARGVRRWVVWRARRVSENPDRVVLVEPGVRADSVVGRGAVRGGARPGRDRVGRAGGVASGTDGCGRPG